MKLKYIIASLLAGVTLFSACEKEADTVLSDLKISPSYVSLPVAGGYSTVTITANADWAFQNIFNNGTKEEPKMEPAPKWLTLSAVSGGAGETSITLTAEAAEGRTAELRIACGNAVQFINVIQGVATVSTATCAEVMNGPDKTYRVTGVVTRIANTEYGNWYMMDDSEFNWAATSGNKDGLYIYGTLDKKGNNGKNNSIEAWGLEVGDEVTIEGPRKDYNGTIEMVDVSIIKITKSLISIETVFYPEQASALPLEGGDVKVTLSNKGNNLSVVIPDEFKSWLAIGGLNGNEVTLTAAPNEGGDREGLVIFKTTDGKKEYSAELPIFQKGAIKDVTVAEALAVIAALEDGATTTAQFRVSGVVAKVSDVSTSYGNATYLLSDDGTEENALTVFRCMYLDGEKFTDANQIAAGDVVVVLGKLQKYVKNEAVTPELTSGSLVSIDRPISVAAALEVVAALADGATTENTFYVKGIVTGEAGIDVAYGNATFKITDDGLAASNALTVFRAKDFGNQKFTEADAFKGGDTAILVGKLQKYVKNEAVTPELSGGYFVGLIPGEAPAQGITVDGDPSDWEGLEGVASDVCPAEADLTGIKSAKAYYGDKLYLLAEFSNDAFAKGVTDGKLRFHVFFSGAEGLLSRFWKDENIEYMIEGKATSGGFYTNFGGNYHKFKGETSAAWSWDDAGVASTVTSAGKGNFYEIAIDYANYPGGFPEQVEIGMDCADGNYAVLGFAPQTPHKFILKKGEVVEPEEEPEEMGEFGTNVQYTGVSSAYTDNTVNVTLGEDTYENVANLKMGTSSKFGNGYVTLPGGTTKVTFYSVAWKGAPATLKVSLAATWTSVDDITWFDGTLVDVKANDGASGSTPYAITVTASDKYEITFPQAIGNEGSYLKFETLDGGDGHNNGKRAFVMAVQALK